MLIKWGFTYPQITLIKWIFGGRLIPVCTTGARGNQREGREGETTPAIAGQVSLGKLGTRWGWGGGRRGMDRLNIDCRAFGSQ